jgi:hypothetical protein
MGVKIKFSYDLGQDLAVQHFLPNIDTIGAPTQQEDFIPRLAIDHAFYVYNNKA